MNPTSVLRPPYIAYFRDFSRFRSWLWAAAFVASILVHAFVVWRASVYVPRVHEPEVRVDIRMIEPERPVPPPPPPPPQKIIEPPPPPPTKPTPKPPKEVPRPAPPLPVLAAPPAPAEAPSERVVAVQPPPAPLPPIDAPPPPPAPPAPPAPAPVAPPPENYDALINSFGREVGKLFESNQRYPAVARTRNQQGSLELVFEFDNGQLVNVSVKQSSGFSVLDNAAVEVGRKMKLPPFPGSLAQRKFSFVLPVNYRLQGS